MLHAFQVWEQDIDAWLWEVCLMCKVRLSPGYALTDRDGAAHVQGERTRLPQHARRGSDQQTHNPSTAQEQIDLPMRENSFFSHLKRKHSRTVACFWPKAGNTSQNDSLLMTLWFKCSRVEVKIKGKCSLVGTFPCMSLWFGKLFV